MRNKGIPMDDQPSWRDYVDLKWWYEVHELMRDPEYRSRRDGEVDGLNIISVDDLKNRGGDTDTTTGADMTGLYNYMAAKGLVDDYSVQMAAW